MPGVTSSAIASIDWEESTERLAIAMKDGSVLVYSEVPQGIYEDFVAAGSKGGFFNREIRDRYPFEYG